MKRKMWTRTVSLLLVLSVLCACTALGIGTLTAAAYDNWGDAYADFLRKGVKDGKFYAEYSRFAVAYIDSDDTPELLVNFYIGGQIALYTFTNDRVVQIGTYEFSYNGVSYYNRSGFFETFFSGRAAGVNGYIKDIYRLSGTSCTHVDTFYYELKSEGYEYYEVNDVEVSEEEYNRRYNQYKEKYGEPIDTNITEYKLTESNYSKFLKSSGTTAPTTTTTTSTTATTTTMTTTTTTTTTSTTTATTTTAPGTTAATASYDLTASTAGGGSVAITPATGLPNEETLNAFLVSLVQTFIVRVAEGAPALSAGMPEYDSATAGDSLLLADLLYGGAYSAYYEDGSYGEDSGNRTEYWSFDADYQPDPKQLFPKNYTKTDASRVDWVAKNLFNCTDSDIESMRRNGQSSFAKTYADEGQQELERFYYDNGYYYCGSTSSGANASDLEITGLNLEKIGEYYYATYSYVVKSADGKASAPVTQYAKYLYRNIDGKDCWTLIRNAQTKFWEQTEESTDAAEAVGSAKGSGSKTLLLLLAGVAIAAPLAALMVFLILRSKKKSDESAQQPVWQAQPQPQLQDNPYSAQYAPPAEPPVRYISRETGYGGRCAKCGTAVGVLTEVSEIRGQNGRHIGDYCRNCAAAVIRQAQQRL